VIDRHSERPPMLQSALPVQRRHLNRRICLLAKH
jgi:hypothetical protein